MLLRRGLEAQAQSICVKLDSLVEGFIVFMMTKLQNPNSQLSKSLLTDEVFV